MKTRAIAASGLLTATVLSPLSVQAATVVPGAPMVTYYAEPVAGLNPSALPLTCSQGPNGTVTLPNGKKAEVMLTAGHCVRSIGNVGPEVDKNVEVPTKEGNVVIGTIDRAQAPVENPQGNYSTILEGVDDTVNSADYGTVRLSEEATTSGAATSIDGDGHKTGSVKLTKIRDYKDVPAGQVRFDNLGQPICYKGQTSGGGCGVQVLRAENGVWSVIPYQKGDSGGVNYDPETGEVIGVTSMVYGPVGRAMPADKALEEAYNIPDGQVNEHFQVTESQEKMDSMVPFYSRPTEEITQEEAMSVLQELYVEPYRQ